MASKYLENLYEKIYSDSSVSPAEIIKLRDAVDRLEKRILEEEGFEGTTATLFKSFDVTNQLLQENLLELRQGEYSDTGREMVYSAVASNIDLLRASLDGFTK